MKGIIFNIMHYSIHDGPGIRTTVFMKGCPLSCLWCHNPESVSADPQTVFYPKKCVKCGACEKGFECPSGARETIGYEITPGELLGKVSRDVTFYEQSGGGVTFSGGEPLYQPEFLVEMLRLCREEYIHTAVDTSGYCERSAILEAAKYARLFLYDLKTMDDTLHRKFCGQSNRIILENLEAIARAGAKIYARIPVIPSVNDNMAEMRAMVGFLKDLGIKNVYLLPYHNIQSDKYDRLGLVYELKEFPNLENEALGDFEALFEKFGFATKIGG